jgi:type II secretory pathway pseudopilin PulG
MMASSAFLGVLSFELTRSQPRSCGCFGSEVTEFFSKSMTPRTALMLSAAVNACILSTGTALFFSKRDKRIPSISLSRSARAQPPAQAFTVVELLVVIGVVALLIGLLFPVLGRMRERAKATQCASNLHQISQAFAGYCAENRGVTPRYGLYNTPGLPLWLEVIPPHLAAPKNFEWSDLPKVGVLQCPSHPTPKIPSGYVLNAFAFETAPA